MTQDPRTFGIDCGTRQKGKLVSQCESRCPREDGQEIRADLCKKGPGRVACAGAACPTAHVGLYPGHGGGEGNGKGWVVDGLYLLITVRGFDYVFDYVFDCVFDCVCDSVYMRVYICVRMCMYVCVCVNVCMCVKE